ncbi:MAG: MAPEG family protein [Deltaproteobacteria bacterium]
MNSVYVVMGLALMQFVYFGIAVGGARGRYGVPAPATTGNEAFERYFRVQMNTLELIVVLLPAMALFGYYVSSTWATGLGGIYLIGRFLYFFAYVKDPKTRTLGFSLSMLPIMVMLVGGTGGAVLALYRG